MRPVNPSCGVAGRQAVMIASNRYQEGKASNYEVLEAQPQLVATESARSRIEVGRRLTVVQLHKTLGGGGSLPTTPSGLE